jgi:hypothetical protein
MRVFHGLPNPEIYLSISIYLTGQRRRCEEEGDRSGGDGKPAAGRRRRRQAGGGEREDGEYEGGSRVPKAE